MVQCPVVVVGRGLESGNVALRVRYEGRCLRILVFQMNVGPLKHFKPLTQKHSGIFRETQNHYKKFCKHAKFCILVPSYQTKHHIPEGSNLQLLYCAQSQFKDSCKKARLTLIYSLVQQFLLPFLGSGLLNRRSPLLPFLLQCSHGGRPY